MSAPDATPSTNQFKPDLPKSVARDLAGLRVDSIAQKGGMFVEAVRLTPMPMLVTDATLPGNPITFANGAFIELSGYRLDELLGQDAHFMNGEGTDPKAIKAYTKAILDGRDETLELVQYRKDGAPFRAMLFASPIVDGQGRITSHFLSYLDITRRWQAEESLRSLTIDLEERVTARTKDLQAANALLGGLVAERDLLVIEVNHRAKNSLAVAASLLAVQGRRQTDPAVRDQFEAAQERLNSMARVHDLLSKSESGQRIDLATYLVQLCDALGGAAEQGVVRLRAEADTGILLDADTAFPLGIVLTELITNALKYAFPNGRKGIVQAQAQRLADGRAELLVRDNGIGMADMREGSLGYGLVRSLVKQIGGEITVEGGSGVTVRIVFDNTHS